MANSAYRRIAYLERSKNRAPDACRTILGFCENNAISLSFYRALKRAGKGPAEIKLLNKRIVITAQAEQDWREARQRESDEAAAKAKAAKARAEKAESA
jgi:hypothetical protein